MAKDSVFVLKTLNSLRESPSAYIDDAVKDQVLSSASSQSQSVAPASSHSSLNCDKESVGDDALVATALPAQEDSIAASEVRGNHKDAIAAPIERIAVEDYSRGDNGDGLSPHAEDPKLKKEMFDKIAELGRLIIGSGTSFVLCLEKVSIFYFYFNSRLFFRSVTNEQFSVRKLHFHLVLLDVFNLDFHLSAFCLYPCF